jgi:hypothetical protein
MLTLISPQFCGLVIDQPLRQLFLFGSEPVEMTFGKNKTPFTVNSGDVFVVENNNTLQKLIAVTNVEGLQQIEGDFEGTWNAKTPQEKEARDNACDSITDRLVTWVVTHCPMVAAPVFKDNLIDPKFTVQNHFPGFIGRLILNWRLRYVESRDIPRVHFLRVKPL